MSSYKITQFSAANIAGNCKLVDNKLKSSSGADITFPSSGGTLATLADSVSKVVSANVNLGGTAGNLYLKYVEFGAGDNKVQMMHAEISLNGAWGGTAATKNTTNSNLAGLGEWTLYIPTSIALQFTGRFAVTIDNSGKIIVATPLATTVDATGSKGEATVVKTPGNSDVSITLA